MRPFDYEVATDAPSAVAVVAGRADATFLGGGTNLIDHMKLGVVDPALLVDVTRLPTGEITDRPDGGLRIGATVRNSDLAADRRVRARYPVLSQALLAGASGQIRNMATTAGNLLQHTRCVYFQDVTTSCNKREPGSGCSALGGYTRYHAILGASEHCIATHPSDMAVGLAVLDASVVVAGVDGERSVPFEDLHRLPGDRPDLDTTRAHGELVTAVDLPAPGRPARSAYRKVRDRSSYAFALVSVAVVVSVEEGTVTDVRIALGGVAHKPWRAHAAEEALRGAPATTVSYGRAADAELAAAEPQDGNRFKVPMAHATLVGTLRDLTTEDT